MSEPESSQLESVSAVSLSGTSVSLSTLLTHHRQRTRVEREGEGEEVGAEDREREREGQKRDGSEQKGSSAAEKEVQMLEEQVASMPVCPTRKEQHQTQTTKPLHTSPNTPHSEDGVQCLLNNIPIIQQEFDLVSKIGEGTFSSVYLASLKGRPEEKFALKHLVPTSASSRIENELKCLQSMGGRDNVIPLLTCVRHRDHIVLIMPYFPHSRFTDYLPLMAPTEVQLYMKALLTALRNVHSHHIIHRDIKPSNFLYNRDTGRFQLVDFGLAHLEPGRLTSASSSSATTHPAHPKTRSRTTQVHLSLVTPPTSSSAHLTKPPLTGTATHHQVHLNGIGLIPPQTYQRQLQSRLQARSGRVAEGGREKGRGEGVMKRRGRSGGCGSEGEKGRPTRGGGDRGCGSEETHLCPLRHKATEVCDFCMSRSHQNAPRAGTPGFRAPEVLLKCPNQTTAVDVWSAGVIFLCLLSGRYPFFRAHDDLSALAQIIALMGSRECKRTARELGKELVCGQHIEPVNLKELCKKLRNMLYQQPAQEKHSQELPSKKSRLNNGEISTAAHCRYELRSPQRRKSPRKFVQASPMSNPKSPTIPSTTKSHGQAVGKEACNLAALWERIPDSAFDLLYKCLELNPSERITAEEALQHPFLAGDITR